MITVTHFELTTVLYGEVPPGGGLAGGGSGKGKGPKKGKKASKKAKPKK